MTHGENSMPNVQVYSLSSVIGEAIKQKRISLGFSADQFAERIGKTADFVCRLERAEVSLDSQVFYRCAEVLGMTVVELVQFAINIDKPDKHPVEFRSTNFDFY